MFVGVGIAFAWGATNYKIGDSVRMGPGYFPFMLGILMALVGLLVTWGALQSTSTVSEKIGKWAWRPLFYVIAWAWRRNSFVDQALSSASNRALIEGCVRDSPSAAPTMLPARATATNVASAGTSTMPP